MQDDKLILSHLDKQYSLLLAPGCWQRFMQRLLNSGHRLTHQQSHLVMMSWQKFSRRDYCSALMLLADCIDTPEGMEEHTTSKVGAMASLMESLCGLRPWPLHGLYTSMPVNRRLMYGIENAPSFPSYKATVIERLKQTRPEGDHPETEA